MNTFELLYVDVFFNFEDNNGGICVKKDNLNFLNKKENDIVIINEKFSKNYYIVKLLKITNEFKSYGIDFLNIKVQVLEVGGI